MARVPITLMTGFPCYFLTINYNSIRDIHTQDITSTPSLASASLNSYHFQRRGTEVINMFFSRLARSVGLRGPSGLFVRSAVEYIAMPGRSSRNHNTSSYSPLGKY